MINAREHERVVGSLFLLLEPREKEESSRCEVCEKEGPRIKETCITSTRVLTFSEVRKDSSECKNQGPGEVGSGGTGLWYDFYIQRYELRWQKL